MTATRLFESQRHWLLFALIPVAFGGYCGYAFAYGRTQGVWGSILAPMWLVLAGFVAIVLVVSGLLLASRSRRSAARLAVAAALVAASTAAGWAAVSAFDLGYHAQVIPEPSVRPTLEASLVLTTDLPEWLTSDRDGRGICPFGTNGAVRMVSVEQAGSARSHPVAFVLEPEGAWEPGATVSLLLVANTLASSGIVPAGMVAATNGDYLTWSGSGTLGEVDQDGTGGRATFVNLPQTGQPVQGWPGAVSGEVDWTCS